MSAPAAPAATDRGRDGRAGRIVAALLAVGAVIALAAAPPPAQPVAVDQYRPVSSAVLTCPELAVTEDSASVLSSIVAPGAPDGGTAALRAIDGSRDLARVTEAGQPLSVLVAQRSQSPILLVAGGQWAPGAAAGVATSELEGAGAGISSAACPVPASEWWFVGGGSQLGRATALLVSNPAQEPARFDINLLARSGPVAALAGKGINLGPQSHVRLRLDALAPDEDLLAIQVRATSGRVAAAVRDVAVPRGESPRGVDFIPPAVAPRPQTWIAGIPGGDGDRDLVLANPGTQFATVRTTFITEAGTIPLANLETVAVPAGSVITTALDQVLGGRPGTLVLSADVPVTGGMRLSWGAARRDVSWLSAAPPVDSPNEMAAASAVPGGPELTTTVTIAAPSGEVSGTLEVVTTGGADDSIFTESGVLAADPGASGSGADGDGTSGDSPSGDGTPGDGTLEAGSADDGTAILTVPNVSVITAPSTAQSPITVLVPPGTQRTLTIPGTQEAGLVHLLWRSAPGSGPALISHLSLDEARPAATGYSWWPTVSAVPATPVREDVGTLAPVD